MSDTTMRALIDLLTEDEESDREARIAANKAADAIQEWFARQTDLSSALTPSPVFGGSFVLKAESALGEHSNGLLLVFAPSMGNKAGGFGFAGHRPVIVLGVLLRPNDLIHLQTRFNRSTFVHEYMHYLSWKYNRRGKTDAADALDNAGETEYYNHADELNAYYQEGTSDFYRTVRAVIRWGHMDAAMEMWGSKTTQEIVRYVITRNLNKAFVAALTPQNCRRVEKRLARFIEQTIRPMFSEPPSAAA